MSRVIKVCGATSPDEIDQVSAGGAQAIGLWWDVQGSQRSLPSDTLTALAGLARRKGIEPFLVTFSADADAIADCLRATDIQYVQLHAFQSPDMVRRLHRAGGNGIRIIKVLHCTADECLDVRFAESYALSGSHRFILDSIDDDRIGSTGRHIRPSLVEALLERLPRPALLAGGIGPSVPQSYTGIVNHEHFAGIDVDSAARDANGMLGQEEISALVEAWNARQDSGTAKHRSASET